MTTLDSASVTPCRPARIPPLALCAAAMPLASAARADAVEVHGRASAFVGSDRITILDTDPRFIEVTTTRLMPEAVRAVRTRCAGCADERSGARAGHSSARNRNPAGRSVRRRFRAIPHQPGNRGPRCARRPLLVQSRQRGVTEAGRTLLDARFRAAANADETESGIRGGSSEPRHESRSIGQTYRRRASRRGRLRTVWRRHRCVRTTGPIHQRWCV